MCCNAKSRKHYADNKDWYANYARERMKSPDNRQRANRRAAESKARRRQSIYKAWFEYQGGACAVCGKLQESWELMHLDHDHRTGSGRMLCCKTCNYLLGMADDDREVLLRAVEYLDTHGVDLSLPKDFQKWNWWEHFPPI